MVTMIDEIYDRHYLEARSALNASISDGLSRFGRAIANAFLVLNRIEYSAPWSSSARNAPCN
jgi:hypothetical protein